MVSTRVSEASAACRFGRVTSPLFVAFAVLTGGCDAADPVAPRWAAAGDAAIGDRFDVPFPGIIKGGKVPAGRLAFSGWDGAGLAIYTMNPDGSNIVRLTVGSDPSWSPDGRRIAFWRPDRSNGGIFVMTADGSNITRIVADGYQPTWSPDGERIAFGCGGICVINVNGTGRIKLTAHDLPSLSYDVCIRDSDPAWSPNGSTIAFTRWPDVAIPTPMCLTLFTAMNFPFDFWTEIWFVEADGSKLRPLKNDEGVAVTYAGWPAWSPGGEQLAFYFASGAQDGIAVVKADGSDRRNVSTRTPPDWELFAGGPDWSPDGKRIVLGSGPRWGFADPTGGGTVYRNPPLQIPSRFAVWSWSRR